MRGVPWMGLLFVMSGGVSCGLWGWKIVKTLKTVKIVKKAKTGMIRY